MAMHMVNEECPSFCQDCYNIGCENCELNTVEEPTDIEAFKKLIEVCTNTPEEKKMFTKSIIIFIIVGIILFTSPFIIMRCLGYTLVG